MSWDRSLVLATAVERMAARVGDSVRELRYLDTFGSTDEIALTDQAVKRQAAALRRLLDALRRAP